MDSFRAIEELFLDMKNSDSLGVICEAVNYVDYTPVISMVYVAETILGRGSAAKQDGMIFVAKACGDQPLVSKLMEQAKWLTTGLTTRIANEEISVEYIERTKKLQTKIEQIQSAM